MTYRLPLSALLSRLLVAFTEEFDQELATAGHDELSLALGSNVLRFLDTEKGLRVGDIAALAGVTKQAISQQLAYLERHGQVTVTPDPSDGRAKVVHLTDHGARTRDVCRPLFATIEQRWATRHGADTVADLRSVLESISAELDGGLPHFPR